MNSEWLRTLVAVIDEGSFEAAADELHVSASAVSQRIKAMESHLGRLVVRRTLPCTVTEAGEQLLRMARQVLLLEDETLAELTAPQAAGVLRAAVNADSLATWFRPVLTEAAGWSDVTLRLEVEDQDHSSALLRRGDVMGVVTSQAGAVTGCRQELLGRMRYLPVAAPSLVERHRRGSEVDLATLPALRYNAKDDLQLALLRRRGIDVVPPQPQLPGSEAFLAGVEAGLGWGMIPQVQLGDALETGRLELLCDEVLDLPLYWQAWRIESTRVSRLGEAVRRAARAGLLPG
ncbi:LysR family transcriptional regulator ArgP [Luteococcus peritonei]|uniref:LysR family transcriptional regulator ArgP n=1 Tax=Luteococcus peritonei TaxID=88874 RepID=A0ABW4RUX1_9ACTN